MKEGIDRDIVTYLMHTSVDIVTYHQFSHTHVLRTTLSQKRYGKTCYNTPGKLTNLLWYFEKKGLFLSKYQGKYIIILRF